MTATATPRVDTRTWSRWTSECSLVVTDVTTADRALDLAHSTMDEVGAAIDRFDPSSELSRLGAGTTTVTPLLTWFVGTALDAARRTDGLVSPAPRNGSRWSGIVLAGDELSLPDGLALDLGATGKAAAADLVAGRIHRRLGTGVLVSLGGDIATAGAGPVAGWQVEVRDADDDPPAVIALTPGAAVATSSTLHRRTTGADGLEHHHVLDPRTGSAALTPWRTATVVAPTCAEANTLSTAAIVLGSAAVGWLTETGLPARLVDHEGRVTTLGDFPEGGRR
jgi:thiamine biosynthesis lipoprotein